MMEAGWTGTVKAGVGVFSLFFFPLRSYQRRGQTGWFPILRERLLEACVEMW
jgi:hypothetical protein